MDLEFIQRGWPGWRGTVNLCETQDRAERPQRMHTLGLTGGNPKTRPRSGGGRAPWGAPGHSSNESPSKELRMVARVVRGVGGVSQELSTLPEDTGRPSTGTIAALGLAQRAMD